MKTFNYYVGSSAITKYGRSSAEVMVRLAVAMPAVAGLSQIWRSKDISVYTELHEAFQDV